jgi:hypothetical protein
MRRYSDEQFGRGTLSFKVTPELIAKMAKKRGDKWTRKVMADREKPIRTIWKIAVQSESSSIRAVLLEAVGWDQGWAVMEWHRLPKPLQKDLLSMPWSKLQPILNADGERLKKSSRELQKAANDLDMIYQSIPEPL